MRYPYNIVPCVTVDVGGRVDVVALEVALISVVMVAVYRNRNHNNMAYSLSDKM